MKNVKIDGCSIIIDGEKVFERDNFYRSVIETVCNNQDVAAWIYRYSYSSRSGGQNINYYIFYIKEEMEEPKEISILGTNTERMSFNRMGLEISDGTKEIIVFTTDNKGGDKRIIRRIDYND